MEDDREGRDEPVKDWRIVFPAPLFSDRVIPRQNWNISDFRNLREKFLKFGRFAKFVDDLTSPLYFRPGLWKIGILRFYIV